MKERVKREIDLSQRHYGAVCEKNAVKRTCTRHDQREWGYGKIEAADYHKRQDRGGRRNKAHRKGCECARAAKLSIYVAKLKAPAEHYNGYDY